MKAKDVMTPNVITVSEHTTVAEIATTLLKWRISAVPVVDAKERLIGIVSEGDLVRRVEAQTDRAPPWWLAALGDPDERATDYVKSHGHLAKDVMTEAVVTVEEDTSVAEIANLLEAHRIKRVPVLRQSNVIGIVSRANLLHGLASADPTSPPSDDDRELRAAVLNRLRNEAGVGLASLNVTVADRVVHLWGTALSEAQKVEIRVATESIPGVSAVEDHLSVLPPLYRQWLANKH